MSTCVTSFWVMDVGNTRTKWALWQDNVLSQAGFCLTQDVLGTPDLSKILPVFTDQPIVLSSVVPQVTACLQQAFLTHQTRCKVVDLAMLDQIMGSGLDLSQYASTLGLDRALNLLGARLLFPYQRLLVCDFGTTVTCDLLSKEGVFLGGAIAPGARLFQKTLNPKNAAQLYEVDIMTPPTQTPGLDTPQSLANGLYWGYYGMIYGVLLALCHGDTTCLAQTPVILTGGDAESVYVAFAQLWPRQSAPHPQLTLFALSALGQACWGEKQGLS